jgi:hypothetical protein
MPDSMTLFSSYRDAKRYAHEMASEYHEHIVENIASNHCYYFTREEWQGNNSWPYMIVVEPVSWRYIAHDIGVSTRTEVLEHDFNL